MVSDSVCSCTLGNSEDNEPLCPQRAESLEVVIAYISHTQNSDHAGE